MERIDKYTMECIAHVKQGKEPILEEVDPYGKSYVTDDIELEDKERVLRCGYKLVDQYCKGYEWLDIPDNEVLNIVKKGFVRRQILRKLF